MIRRATREDAAAIARVHVASWQFAYAEILDRDQLAAIDVGERTTVWQERLEDAAWTTWVAEAAGRVVGFATLEGDRLRALYVDPIAQGAGVGTALLTTAEQAGARWLHVFAANGHARAFYEDRGWRLEGRDGEWLDRPLVKYAK